MFQLLIAFISILTSIIALYNVGHFVQVEGTAGAILMLIFSGIALSEALRGYALLSENEVLIWLHGGSVILLFVGTAVCWLVVLRKQLVNERG